MSAFVEVIGRGVAAAPADQVEVQLRVEAHDRHVPQALRAAGALAAAVADAARAAGATDRDLTTSAAGVHPDHDEQGRRCGYVAYQGLTVRVRDVDAVGRLLEGASAAVGDALGVDLSLRLADPEPVRARAREAAVADARASAAHYARLAGRTLGDIISIAEGPGGHGGPVPVSHAMYAPLERGEQQVEAVVSVRFTLA